MSKVAGRIWKFLMSKASGGSRAAEKKIPKVTHDQAPKSNSVLAPGSGDAVRAKAGERAQKFIVKR